MNPPAESLPPCEPGVPPRTETAALAVLAIVCVGLVLVRLSADRGLMRPTEPEPLAIQIDVNAAAAADLLQLPGVGPGLAQAIVRHRDEQGLFRTVEELERVPGIGPKMLDRLRPHLALHPGYVARGQASPDEPEPAIERLERKPTSPAAPTHFSSGGSPDKSPHGLPDRSPGESPRVPPSASTLVGPSPAAGKVQLGETININTASLAELQRLPGIGPKIAERILQARQQAPFTSLDDLRRVSGIGVKTIEKLRPYVTW